MRRQWYVHVLVLVAYAALALALTWPLLPHLGAYVPGNGSDDPPLTWNLWWVRYSLLDLGTNPFQTDYLFYPIGINLAFYTLTVLNGLLSLPLQATLGLIPSSNLVLLSSYVLSAYGMFLLAGYLLQEWMRDQRRGSSAMPYVQHLPAFAAGVLYAFASNKLFYAALGQWNIASSQWIPFYVLCLLRTGQETRRWRHALLAALFLLLQAYAELTYASFLLLFTLLWAVVHGLALLRLPRADARRQSAVHLAVRLLAVGVLFVIGLAPVLAEMIPDLRVEGDIFSEGGGFADVFSADLLGFLVPTMLHPLFGSLVQRFQFDYAQGQHLYLGYSVFILALVGVIRWWRPRRSRGTLPSEVVAPGRSGVDTAPHPSYSVRFWSLCGVWFWLLTLGPTLRINGHSTGLPLPFSLLAELPFFRGNRYPSRYGVMQDLSLAVLVAFGLAAVCGWIQGREAFSQKPGASWHNRAARVGGRPFRILLAFTAPLIVALVAFEHLSVPLPLTDMRIPPVYASLTASVPGEWTLLDLPVSWRNGSRVTGTLDPIIMFEQYYQAAHLKRVLAGNTSRNPPLKFQYFTEAPVINTLIALETGHSVDAAVLSRDRGLAPEVLRFFSVGAIVVHPTQAGPSIVPYVERTFPVTRVYEGEGTLAYQVHLTPWPDNWTIEPGSDLARLSYAEGWGVPTTGVVWAQRRGVRLLAPMNGQQQSMHFRAYSPRTGQRMAIEVNGNRAAALELATGWDEYDVTLAATQLRQGLNEIWLRLEQLVPTEQVSLSSRSLGQTGIESPANLVVRSAGLEVGDFAAIYVDGRQVSPNSRGYNVVVLNSESGAVEAAAAFDTHIDESASRAMAEFLNGIPVGKIVLVAVADEASRLLGDDAVEALHGIGAVGDLRDKFRWGHAIIGVKGAAPGTASEALESIRPVSLAVGEGATEPHLAAALGPISFNATSER